MSVLSRNTQGVRLIKLSQEDERLVGVERIAETDDEALDGEGEGEVEGEGGAEAADSSPKEGEEGEGAGEE